jgi:hypothetical protein
VEVRVLSWAPSLFYFLDQSLSYLFSPARLALRRSTRRSRRGAAYNTHASYTAPKFANSVSYIEILSFLREFRRGLPAFCSELLTIFDQFTKSDPAACADTPILKRISLQELNEVWSRDI